MFLIIFGMTNIGLLKNNGSNSNNNIGCPNRYDDDNNCASKPFVNITDEELELMVDNSLFYQAPHLWNFDIKGTKDELLFKCTLEFYEGEKSDYSSYKNVLNIKISNDKFEKEKFDKCIYIGFRNCQNALKKVVKHGIGPMLERTDYSYHNSCDKNQEVIMTFRFSKYGRTEDFTLEFEDNTVVNSASVTTYFLDDEMSSAVVFDLLVK